MHKQIVILPTDLICRIETDEETVATSRTRKTRRHKNTSDYPSRKQTQVK